MEGVDCLYLFIAAGFFINLICACMNLRMIQEDDIVERPIDHLWCDDVFEVVIAGKPVICVVEESTSPSKLMIKFKILNYKNNSKFMMNISDLLDCNYKFLGTIGTYHHLLCA